MGIGVKASVGINRDQKFKDEIHTKLMEIPDVTSISEITGRFDIMINIIAVVLLLILNIKNIRIL